MSGDRAKLDIPDFTSDELDDFAPRQKTSHDSVAQRREIDRHATFPSREPSRADEEIPYGQLNVRAPKAVIERFKAICKDDRRAYHDMLNILMDLYDERR